MTDDLKANCQQPCPFCGCPTWTVTEDENESMCKSCCCVVYDEHRDERPIEDALRQRIAELENFGVQVTGRKIRQWCWTSFAWGLCAGITLTAIVIYVLEVM